jgi:N-acetylneuraminic acid mutarotase
LTIIATSLAAFVIGCPPDNGPDTTPISGGGNWVAFKKPPVPLHEAGAVVLGDHLYYVGGRLPSGTIATLYRYSPDKDEWTQLASHPGTAVDHLQAVVLNDLIYVIGGTIEWPGPSVNQMYSYAPATNSWTQRASMPRVAGAMGVGVVGGKIYVIGGLSGGQASNLVLEYDPVMDEWADLTGVCPMPTARDHFVAVTFDEKIHCIGGRQVDIGSILDVHEIFDPATKTWGGGAPLPTARAGFSAALLGSEILIMGGEGANNSKGVFSENEAYDPATDTWRKLSPMTAPRHSTQAGVIGGIVYVAAGSPTQGRTYTDVHEGFIP